MLLDDTNTATIVTRLRIAGCVFAEDEARIIIESAHSPAQIDEFVERRSTGEPLEYIVGWADFAGVRVIVKPGVFVPRERSRLLVDVATNELLARGPRPRLLELCCGTAAITAALTQRVPDFDAMVTDIDPVAVECARLNVPAATAIISDLFAQLDAATVTPFDVVIANAPYVPTGELDLLPSEARDYEPDFALDGGADGVEVHRRIAREVAPWLRPGGVVIIESSRYQEHLTGAALADAGFSVDIVHDDDLEATVVRGTRVKAP